MRVPNISGLPDVVRKVIEAMRVFTKDIDNDAIDNTKLANMVVNTIKGRITAGTGDPEDLSAANVLSIIGLTGITGAWTSFTPSWTNLTVGNGTNEGVKLQIGKLVICEVKFIYGTGSSIAGPVFLTLPVAAKSYSAVAAIGSVDFRDFGTALYHGRVLSSGALWVFKSDATYLTSTTLSSTVPHTWASTDEILIKIIYEAA